MKTILLLSFFSVAAAATLTGCQASGSYQDDRAGYPYSGQNKKKMSYAEQKFLRPR